MHGETMK